MIQVTLRRSFSFHLLASIVAGIICIPGFAYAQRPMPIENGVLRTDLNAATFSINNATNVTASGNFIGNLTGNAATATNATYSINAGNATFANTSTNSSYSTTAGNASFANTSTNATYAVTAGNLTSFPGNLVYTDVANQTITGNLTLNGTSTRNLTSSTGNLALNGTNLTLDTGDIKMNGGDVTNISNLTGTAGFLTIGNGTSIVNASFIGGAGGLLNYLEFTGFVGFRNNSGNYARLSANDWSINAGLYTATYNTNGAGETLNNLTYGYSRGWLAANREVMQLSGTNLTLSIVNIGPPTADFFIYKSSVAIAANRTLTLPNTIVATDSIVSGNTTFNGTITLAQRTNHTVNSVAGGGNITNSMSFARVTSTGNVTVFDGASGDWITVKNNSGGVITLLSADTFDGNASISLNNNEAVSLTSTGTDWMIH